MAETAAFNSSTGGDVSVLVKAAESAGEEEENKRVMKPMVINPRRYSALLLLLSPKSIVDIARKGDVETVDSREGGTSGIVVGVVVVVTAMEGVALVFVWISMPRGVESWIGANSSGVESLSISRVSGSLSKRSVIMPCCRHVL